MPLTERSACRLVFSGRQSVCSLPHVATCSRVLHSLPRSAPPHVRPSRPVVSQRIACPALDTGVVSERLATMPGAVRYACLHPSIKGLAILGTPTAFCIVHLLRQGPQVRSERPGVAPASEGLASCVALPIHAVTPRP